MTALRSAARIATLMAALLWLGAGAADAKSKKPAPEPTPAADAPPVAQFQFPIDQTFSLREMNGKPVSSELDVSLKIDGTFQASGFSGCNSWTAVARPYNAAQKLQLGPPALTKKTCSKDLMQIENTFLVALFSQPSWTLVNGDLVFKGPKGTLRMVRSL